MFLIAGTFFILSVLAYIVIVSAVIYHLRHYALPGWTEARVVVPAFLLLSAALFILAAYFFFSIPWE